MFGSQKLASFAYLIDSVQSSGVQLDRLLRQQVDQCVESVERRVALAEFHFSGNSCKRRKVTSQNFNGSDKENFYVCNPEFRSEQKIVKGNVATARKPVLGLIDVNSIEHYVQSPAVAGTRKIFASANLNKLETVNGKRGLRDDVKEDWRKIAVRKGNINDPASLEQQVREDALHEQRIRDDQISVPLPVAKTLSSEIPIVSARVTRSRAKQLQPEGDSILFVSVPAKKVRARKWKARAVPVLPDGEDQSSDNKHAPSVLPGTETFDKVELPESFVTREGNSSIVNDGTGVALSTGDCNDLKVVEFVQQDILTHQSIDNQEGILVVCLEMGVAEDKPMHDVEVSSLGDSVVSISNCEHTDLRSRSREPCEGVQSLDRHHDNANQENCPDNVQIRITTAATDRVALCQERIATKETGRVSLCQEKTTAKETDRVPVVQERITTKETDKVSLVQERITTKETDTVSLFQERIASKETNGVSLCEERIMTKETNRVSIFQETITTAETDRVSLGKARPSSVLEADQLPDLGAAEEQQAISSTFALLSKENNCREGNSECLDSDTESLYQTTSQIISTENFSEGQGVLDHVESLRLQDITGMCATSERRRRSRSSENGRQSMDAEHPVMTENYNESTIQETTVNRVSHFEANSLHEGQKRAEEEAVLSEVSERAVNVTDQHSILSKLVTNVRSLIPVAQQVTPSFYPSRKRDIKVKALEAAEVAKRLEEKRTMERLERKLKKARVLPKHLTVKEDCSMEDEVADLSRFGQETAVSAKDAVLPPAKIGLADCPQNRLNTGLGLKLQRPTALVSSDKPKRAEELKRKEDWKKKEDEGLEKRNRQEELLKQRKDQEDRLRAELAEKQQRHKAAEEAERERRAMEEEAKRQRRAEREKERERRQREDLSAKAARQAEKEAERKRRDEAILAQKISSKTGRQQCLRGRTPQPVGTGSDTGHYPSPRTRTLSRDTSCTPGGFLQRTQLIGQHSEMPVKNGPKDSTFSNIENLLPLVAEAEDMGPQSYEMSPYRESSDEEDEEERQTKPIPFWADKENLMIQLTKQLTQDPDEIFAGRSTCNLKEVFETGTRRKRDFGQRNSSGDWVKDRVSWKEELQYKINMGYASGYIH